MKTLHIEKGSIIDNGLRYFEISGKHFGDFAAIEYELDDDDNSIEKGTRILTAGDIKSYTHSSTGKAYDDVVYDD